MSDEETKYNRKVAIQKKQSKDKLAVYNDDLPKRKGIPPLRKNLEPELCYLCLGNDPDCPECGGEGVTYE